MRIKRVTVVPLAAMAGIVLLLAACSSPGVSAAPTYGPPPPPKPAPSGQSVPAGASVPRVSVERDALDFGNVPFEKVVQANFVVKNVGTAPLRVLGEPPLRTLEGC